MQASWAGGWLSGVPHAVSFMHCSSHQHFHVLYKTVQRLLLKAKAQ